MDNIYDNNEYSKAMKAILMEIGEDTVKDYEKWRWTLSLMITC